MSKAISICRTVALAVSALIAVVVTPNAALVHYDTLDGPVVKACEKALESGDLTEVLWWIKPECEGEIKRLFQKTLSVRTLGEEARELPDMCFFETVANSSRTNLRL